MIHGMPTVTRLRASRLGMHVRAWTLILCVFSAGVAQAHEDIAPLVAKLKESVVNIEVYGEVIQNETISGIIPKNSPLWDLLNPDDQQPERENDEPLDRRIKIGSGFIISTDGYVVTNNHVVEGGNRIIVEMQDGERVSAEIIGTDVTTDIAVLKIDVEEDMVPVSFGDSEAAREGDTVIAIGNPFGLGFSVSKGIISARYRRMGGIDDEFIQSDAAINIGNSGGPLFNVDGEVIGVNTAIIPGNDGAGTGGSIGISFSMASAVVEKVVDDLIEHGTVRRGWLGIVMQNVSDDFAEALGLDEAGGVLVTAVSKGSPAERAGLERGDVIMSVNGESITDVKHMQRVIVSAGPDVEVSFEIYRKGEIINRTATLELRPESITASQVVESEDEGKNAMLLGMEVTAINEQLRQRYRLGEDATGLVVTGVDQNSEAFAKLIRPGDLIVEINEVEVETLTDAEDAVESARGDGKSKVLLLMVTRGTMVAVTLDIIE